MSAGDDLAQLRAATFNIRYDTASDGVHRWRRRRGRVVEVIRSWEADIVALQEVLPAQRTFLERELNEFQWYGVGRADGDADGEQSPVGLRKSRFQARTWHTTWLSQTPQAVGSLGWDARIPRIATVVRATSPNPGSDDEIGLINTHFDHKSATARLGSARIICELVAADPDRDWIVMGDFNATPGSDVLAEIRAAGLRDVLPPGAGGTLHSWSGRRDGNRIDYLMVSSGWSVCGGWIDYGGDNQQLASDHWPVLAALRRTPR